MRNYFPKRPSGATLHTLSNLYDVPVGVVTPPPPPPFWGCVLLYLRSPKGGCCSISDDLSCSVQLMFVTMFISDIDECLSNPCQNEATCHNHINSYSCTCKSGFEGTNCEIGMSIYKLYSQQRQRVLSKYNQGFMGTKCERGPSAELCHLIRDTGFNTDAHRQWINKTRGCTMHVSYYLYLNGKHWYNENSLKYMLTAIIRRPYKLCITHYYTSIQHRL